LGGASANGSADCCGLAGSFALLTNPLSRKGSLSLLIPDRKEYMKYFLRFFVIQFNFFNRFLKN
jgi:hypothetical protein